MRIFSNPYFIVISAVAILAGAIMMVPAFKEKYSDKPAKFRNVVLLGSVGLLLIIADTVQRFI
jgi:uncharacterized membrane protein HdeD (DUF308 family)